MDRRVLAVGIALLVVFAGCNSLQGSDTEATETTAAAEETTVADEGSDGSDVGGGDAETTASGDDATATPTPTPTATPAPTPTPTPTPTPAPEAGNASLDEVRDAPSDLEPLSSASSLPEGVNEDGSVEIETVTGLMFQQSEQTTSWRWETTLVNSSSADVTIEWTNQSQKTLISLSAMAQGQKFQEDYYIGPDRAGKYNVTSDRTTVATGPSRLEQNAGFLGLFLFGAVQSLNAGQWEAEGVRTVDGEQRLVLTSDAFRDPSQLDEGQELKGVKGYMELNTEGTIRVAEFRYAVEEDGQQRIQGVDMNAEFGDVTVQEPDWLSDPPQMEASAAENNKLLVLEHTGGAEIPAGTELSILVGFSAPQKVTVDQAISPGDTVYVYKTGEGTNAEYTVSVNDKPTTPSDATEFQGTVYVKGSFDNLAFEAAVEL